METDKYVLFHSHLPNKNRLHYFSQWYPVKFTEKISKSKFQIYDNTEQYMMAHKALLFDDIECYDKIMETSDPDKIKKLGRTIKNFDSNIWDEHKFNIVVNGNRLKFSQNPVLLKRLMQTGNKYIAEASPRDKIWGIGLSAVQALKVPRNKWPGENLLGSALMFIREEMASE
jgi:hypothetical protein